MPHFSEGTKYRLLISASGAIKPFNHFQKLMLRIRYELEADRKPPGIRLEFDKASGPNKNCIHFLSKRYTVFDKKVGRMVLGSGRTQNIKNQSYLSV